MLDPLLAPAMQMAERPIVPARRPVDEVAHNLMIELENLGRFMEVSPDGQLANVAEALGVCVISLVAYARGVVPRVKSEKPNVNLILPGTRA